MRTLTLLSILLTVALGKPFEPQEPPVVPPETLQRPLVGDLLPAQGHVVEEHPARKPELGKALQQSAPSTDDKEETPVQEVQEEDVKVEEPPVKQDLTEDNNEIEQVDEDLNLVTEFDGQDMEGLQANAEMMKDIVEEDEEKDSVQEEDVIVEEPPVKQDLTEDNNEIEQVDEDLNLVSELDGQDMEGLQANAEMMNEIVEEDEEKDSVQELELHNEIEVKYDFEQPIMELEPLTNEEMQRDELLEVSKEVYEEPVMFLEPEAVEGQSMNGKNVPDIMMAMEEEAGPMLDPQGEPLQPADEYLPLDEGFMRLEPLESEDQPQVLQFEEPVANGPRSCSGVVLDGKCFQFFTNPKKASEAEYFCQESFYGGHLASITSQNIHNEMMNLMRQNGGTRRTWVGGIRFLDTGRFVWLDGSRWDYADWLWGEPNNTADLEDCIEVLASGKFNDFTCWEPQAFICSYPYQ